MLKYRSTDEILSYNIQRRSYISLGWFSCGLNFSILVELEFRLYVFVKGGKPEDPEKNPRNKDENQQQTQPTYDTGTESNPEHIGGRRALSPLRHPNEVQWSLDIAKGLRIGKKCSLLQCALLRYSSVWYTEGYHMITRFRCIEVFFHTFYYYWGQGNSLLYRGVRYRGSLNRSSTVTTKSRFPYCMLNFKNQEHFQSLKIGILP